MTDHSKSETCKSSQVLKQPRGTSKHVKASHTFSYVNVHECTIRRTSLDNNGERHCYLKRKSIARKLVERFWIRMKQMKLLF